MRKHQPKCELRVWARRVPVLQYIREHELADFADSDLHHVVNGAELLILAMPIQFMAEVVAGFPPLGKEVIVTDVGSTKTSVVDSIAGAVRDLGGFFVGSHPMAGSEKTGIEYAREDLFSGAAVIMTPTSGKDARIDRVKDFWQLIGGVVTLMSPGQHDDIVAAISHLPHLLAAALVRSVLSPNRERAMYSGNGFRDTTRIAGGDPEMWTDIMLANRAAISKELCALQGELERWLEALQCPDKEALRRFLSEAKEIRDDI